MGAVRAVRQHVSAKDGGADARALADLANDLAERGEWSLAAEAYFAAGAAMLGRLADGEPLTAQELRVANLAAYGLSNKDIGQRLFLSPRTVGGHLYRLFPKLGITSRAGLRDALQRLDDTTARIMGTG
jgi:DNA-binding NarL/FixJ family response regulator